MKCFGLTQNPSNNTYMLVMIRMDKDLRKYLQQNHSKLSWEERIQITVYIVRALKRIHDENAIHRDLHSGNLLQSPRTFNWRIGDFGFCGPVNKPLNSIYGNLPYIAPEVIVGKEYTKASDIYSVGMLMWEISSGRPPFINYENDYELAMRIVNGMRPKIVSGTPLEYKILMRQCWDADPLKRPDIRTLKNKIFEIRKCYNQGTIKCFFKRIFKLFEPETNYTSSRIFTSKIYQFENLSEPKNATEGMII